MNSNEVSLDIICDKWQFQIEPLLKIVQISNCATSGTFNFRGEKDIWFMTASLLAPALENILLQMEQQSQSQIIKAK